MYCYDYSGINRRFLRAAALGLLTAFGCDTNTPITTIMVGIEVFELNAIPYYITASLLGYYVSGHNGIYQLQIIYTQKFDFLKVHNKLNLEEIKNSNESIANDNNE